MVSCISSTVAVANRVWNQVTNSIDQRIDACVRYTLVFALIAAATWSQGEAQPSHGGPEVTLQAPIPRAKCTAHRDHPDYTELHATSKESTPAGNSHEQWYFVSETPPAGRTTPPMRGFAYPVSRSSRSRHKPRRIRSTRNKRNGEFWRSGQTIKRWAQGVVDSGCTWHVHHTLSDLVNVVACHDVVVIGDGKEITCEWKGDLPCMLRDARGKELRFLVRGVRYSAEFEDTLLSVDQLWYTSAIDTVFRDVRSLVFTNNTVADGDPLMVPFRRQRGMYLLDMGILGRDATNGGAFVGAHAPRDGQARMLKSGIHSASSTSHVNALPADDIAAVMHRRLHVSLDHLRRLGSVAADVPAHIANATKLTCAACAEANSTKLSHSGSNYEPTHAGRLIHGDIVGPFHRSWHGGYQYALILVDDHTRFKFVYFLQNRSEAPRKVKTFIAAMNAMASAHSAKPIKVVGSLHVDNAGEFISHEFKELMDEESVAQTTCPPHVHQLNGVAERAIRSVVTLARSYLTNSAVSVTHWPHAFEMAVDVLNRTTGPTVNGKTTATSYELLTGKTPKLLQIMPFGCRAFAVKPRSMFSKTDIDPRAWVGINLGRSSSSPGAYHIYVPSLKRIVTTGEVYFQEMYFPARPKGEREDDSAPVPPTTTASGDDNDPQPPGVPEQSTTGVGVALTAHSIAECYASLTKTSKPTSSRVLILFSGPYERPDGIAAFLQRRGLTVDQVDSSVVDGEPTATTTTSQPLKSRPRATRPGERYALRGLTVPFTCFSRGMQAADELDNL